MIDLSARFGDESPSILCIGAHSDDIEIGCGATILQLAAQHPHAQVAWWVLTGSVTPREEEAIHSAEFFLPFRQRRIMVSGYPDGRLGSKLVEVKTDFERVKRDIVGTGPHIIFTHYRHDAHQDHSLVAALTHQTFRDHFILEYEIPKIDGDLGNPNVYIPVGDMHREAKIDALLRFFGSQRNHTWFSRSTFNSMMALRGVTGSSPTGYAEAFYCKRLSLTL